MNSLGLSLPTLYAELSQVKLAAAPKVRPAEKRILLPANLDYHQVADVHIGGDQEGQGAVAIQSGSDGLK